ncbi:fasciclin domain-containing protein [Fragilariopsis cylindrus CCMP1102]|uniref:Fasciclin domain-containing protein n=1 Tax=Fragilariopsis cylindrus CCMP1102 TaxID=635003 RepID=A0A1E7ET32_9STRA|nr:fasciclin domain-containing protein [Fragilariopsis cylindrus CCMP1102]|eukprot:OEU09180.1 fasciclin domain-containing protein [Fragilariopsis cylindrus CCMP1102]
MRLSSSSSSSSLFSSSWTAIGLFLITTFTTKVPILFVKADLRYYVYINENENTVVLESYGSLPLNESISTREGDSCPTNNGIHDGGINPHYLCVGPNYFGNSIEFFPIGPANEIKNEQKLPLKFSSFEESSGISSGLLLWRNVLAIDLSSSTGDNIINGKSYGIDKSNNNYNTQWLLTQTSNSNSNSNPAQDTTADNDNIIIAEWYLLNKMNGQPIFNGGLIQLIQGKPPSVPDRTSSSSAVPVVVVLEAVATATKEAAATIVVKEEEEESESDTNNCESITESICSDDNDSSFSTFCSLLIQVGLDTMLHHNHILSSSESANTNSFYTIYVPTNDAFIKAYQNESISSPPQMLSGHDLTKLLLNHIIGNDDSLPVPYEKMICGTKTYMLNGQITKIGCDANAIVSYVMGVSGNGIHTNSIKPKFVLKNNNKRKNCNGIIHMVDYVILPSQDNDDEEYHEDMITEFTSTTIDIAQEEDEEAIVAAQEDDHDDNDSDPFAFFKGEKEDSSSTVTTVITARTTTTTTTNNSASAKLRPVSTKNPLIVGSNNAADNTADNTNIDIDTDAVDVKDSGVLTVNITDSNNAADNTNTNTNIDIDEVEVEDNGVLTVTVGSNNAAADNAAATDIITTNTNIDIDKVDVEDNGVLTVNVIGSNNAADNTNTNIDIDGVEVEDNGILIVNVGSNNVATDNTNIESQQVQGNSNNNNHHHHRQLLRRRRRN